MGRQRKARGSAHQASQKMSRPCDEHERTWNSGQDKTHLRRQRFRTVASLNLFAACPSLSKVMARDCATAAAEDDDNVEVGFVDLGIAPDESHTAVSSNPDTAVNAFIDFLCMMDAAVVVSTGSSFSTAIAIIKGYRQQKIATRIATRPSIKIVSRVLMFVPNDC